MYTLLTFNIWGTFGPEPPVRWRYAAQCIRSLDPGVLCLQEAADENLLAELSRTTGLALVNSDCDETGLAVLSNLPILKCGLVPYAVLSPLENYIRKFIWVEFGEHGGWTLINTHLSWKKTDDATRAGQIKELADFARGRGAVVACGDFNCEFSGAAARHLLKAGFEDTLGGHPDGNNPTWDNQNPFIRSHSVQFPNRRIDLILADRNFLSVYSVKNSKIVLNQPDRKGVFPSDHYGVLAEFEPRIIRKEPAGDRTDPSRRIPRLA